MEDRSTIARAFVAKAVYNLPTTEMLLDQLIGHICRDPTAIEAREQPEKKEAEIKPSNKRGLPQKGGQRIKQPSRLEKQSTGMSLTETKADLPTACTVGTKLNSKGYKTSWNGYKLHIDATDDGIPVSRLLSSASLHDSQIAIPLAEMTQVTGDKLLRPDGCRL